MRVTFLGGAEEIGASCAVLDLAGTRILIDCGQRMGAPPGGVLPDFSYLEDGPPISAVLLTHAHADHVGALPALEPHLPEDCPILATGATIALARVILEDSLRITVMYRQGDGELAHFPTGTTRAVMRRFQEVRWGKATRIVGTSLKATWFPSGHILGAAMIDVEGPEQSVVFSGDLSVADQLTVSGAFVPSVRPDLLVLESTYGDKLHAHRPDQERRIAERVADCVEHGGHALFPTFALGRAQEVLLVLHKAMREGILPEVPVYADGLVRAASKVYARFVDDMSPWCRDRWEEGLNPIFPDDLPIQPVSNRQSRDNIACGRPCVMVASSGMLQGGASQFYARHWIGDKRNLILVTGYQDEESPGRALLNLASGSDDEPRFFNLGGQRTEVRCGVERFQLSAHADHVELMSIVSKLQPHHVALVHGEGRARTKLAEGMRRCLKSHIIVPNNGQTLDLDPSAAVITGKTRHSPLAEWPPWDPHSSRELDLPRFHEWLISFDPPVQWVTLDELAEIWRSPQPVQPTDVEAIQDAIDLLTQPLFVPDAKRPHILHVTPSSQIDVADTTLCMPVEQTVPLLRNLFGDASGLKRYGFYPEEKTIQLEFVFPRAAVNNFRQRLHTFTKRTGWQAEIVGDTFDADLIDVLQSLAGDNVSPSIFHEDALLRVSKDDLPTDVDCEELTRLFQQKTGYDLRIE